MKNFKKYLLKTNTSLASSRTRRFSQSSDAGFSLLELAVVVIIMGALAAIVAPAWLGFTNRQRLRVSQGDIYRAMQKAQTLAKARRSTMQVSIRENPGNDQVSWAIHSADIDDANNLTPGNSQDKSSENTWHSLEEKVEIFDTQNIPQENDYYYVRFNYNGCPVEQDGDECTQQSDVEVPFTLTLKHQQLGDNSRRCVIVQTLLGGMRTAEGGGCDPNP